MYILKQHLKFLIFSILAILFFYIVTYSTVLLCRWIAKFEQGFLLFIGILVIGFFLVRLWIKVINLVSLLINELNPYPVLGKLLIIPFAIIFGASLIFNFWSDYGIESVSHFSASLLFTYLIIYSTISFTYIISRSKKELDQIINKP
jgi:hypothetical protein